MLRRACLVAFALLVSSCDSTPEPTPPPPNTAPVVRTLDIEAGLDAVAFQLENGPPTFPILVEASDPDGAPVTLTLRASGGTFEASGSHEVSLDTQRERERWMADLSAFVYTFEATASDGQLTTTQSASIEVRPAIQGSWIAARETRPESDRFLGLCIYIRRRDVVDLAFYRLEDRTSGTRTGIGGSVGVGSTFEIPTLTTTFPSSSTGEHPRSMTSAFSLDGTMLSSTLELVNGDTYDLLLERSESFCSHDAVDAALAAL
ncbi:MAG: hypothetical protein AAGI52_18375 [Bacteroidota bacterium]